MSNETHVSQPLYGLLHTDVEGFDSLAELALDMRSSWNHATDQVLGIGGWRLLAALGIEPEVSRRSRPGGRAGRALCKWR